MDVGLIRDYSPTLLVCFITQQVHKEAAHGPPSFTFDNPLNQNWSVLRLILTLNMGGLSLLFFFRYQLSGGKRRARARTHSLI